MRRRVYETGRGAVNRAGYLPRALVPSNVSGHAKYRRPSQSSWARRKGLAGSTDPVYPQTLDALTAMYQK
jgi:hypothetical protein